LSLFISNSCSLRFPNKEVVVKDVKSFDSEIAVDENQIKEAFINGGRGHPPSHLKFFLLVFSKLKEDIK